MSQKDNSKGNSKRIKWAIGISFSLLVLIAICATFLFKPFEPAVEKEAGLLTKDVNVCYYNDSSEKIEFTNFRYTQGNPIGDLRPGKSLCISGERVIAYFTYKDGYASKTIAWNSEVLYPEVVFLTLNLGVETASSYFSEGETVDMVDEGHNWSVTRLDNSDFIEFEYHYLGM
jgi:hypothetical protein